MNRLLLVVFGALLAVVFIMNPLGIRDQIVGSLGGVSAGDVGGAAQNILPEGGGTIQVPVFPGGLGYKTRNGQIVKDDVMTLTATTFVVDSLKVIDDVTGEMGPGYPGHNTLGKHSNIVVLLPREGSESCMAGELKWDGARPVDRCGGRFGVAEVTVIRIATNKRITGANLRVFAAVMIAYASETVDRAKVPMTVSCVTGALLRLLALPYGDNQPPKLNSAQLTAVRGHVEGTWRGHYGLTVSDVRKGFRDPMACPAPN